MPDLTNNALPQAPQTDSGDSKQASEMTLEELEELIRNDIVADVLAKWQVERDELQDKILYGDNYKKNAQNP